MPKKQTTAADVHSCSYYCDRPECIKAQRDELRDRLAERVSEPLPRIAAALERLTVLAEKAAAEG